MRIKNNEKMPFYSKNVVHFGSFTNEMECERVKQRFSNKAIVFNEVAVV